MCAENKIFNSLVFLNSNGDIIHNYDKIHLVPFGEYIPFRSYFVKIANLISSKDFSSGIIKRNIKLEGIGDVLTLICYEILFTKEVVARLTENTNLLINITNDAWFGNINYVLNFGDENENTSSSNAKSFKDVSDQLYQPVKRENKIRVVKIDASGVVVGGF